MKLLMTVNPIDREMIEMWRNTNLGMELLGIVHSDAFEGEVYNALYDENAPQFIEVSLEVVK